jgi:hypothetical protein
MGAPADTYRIQAPTTSAGPSCEKNRGIDGPNASLGLRLGPEGLRSVDPLFFFRRSSNRAEVPRFPPVSDAIGIRRRALRFDSSHRGNHFAPMRNREEWIVLPANTGDDYRRARCSGVSAAIPRAGDTLKDYFPSNKHVL